MKNAIKTVLLLGFIITALGCPTPTTEVEKKPSPPKTYTVTYNANGATTGEVPVDTLKYTSGSTVTIAGNTGNLLNPGNTFIGWSESANGADPVYEGGDELEITGNIVLYAAWSTTLTVTYNGNTPDSGTVPTDSGEYISGDSVRIAGNTGNLVKADNIFNGWSTSANGSGTAYLPGSLYEIEVETVFYARWVPTTTTLYTVTYNAPTTDSGTVPDDTNQYMAGQIATLRGNTGNLVRDGYLFLGWTTASDGTGTILAADDTYEITGNTNFYAKWEELFTVTYSATDSTSGSVPEDNLEYRAGDSATVLGNTGSLVRTNYLFDSWNTESDGSGTRYVEGNTFTVTGDTTLYARWVPTFKVTYSATDSTGGSVPVDANNYLANQNATVLGNTGNLVRTSFAFDSWTTAPNGAGTRYVAGNTFAVTENTTLYAHWVPTYKLTYSATDSTGGSVPVDANNYLANQSATVLGNTGNLVRTGNLFESWNTESDGSGVKYLQGDQLLITEDTTLYAQWISNTKAFNVMDTTDNSWYTVNANLLSVGSSVLVYGEPGAAVTASQALAIAAEFDANINSQIIDNFGEPLDVNDDDRTTLLLLDIRDGYTPGGGYIAGFFQPAHMLDTASYANSNETDMLFMDTYPQTVATAGFYETVAHEFQHLINFSNTAALTGTAQDVWINEGLSAGAEYVYSGTVSQSRVNYYNADPYETIIYGNNFFVWDGYWENEEPNSVLDNYATVYLFFQWLRIHASNGTGIYKDILASEYRDYRAVTEAASTRISSTLSSWSSLLENWLIANFFCRSTGLYGYKNLVPALQRWVFSKTNSYEIALFPGESIMSLVVSGGTSGSYTPPTGSGANMKYRGLNITTFVADSISPYSGHVCLVFNANSDNGGTYETGFASSIATSSSVLFSRQVQTAPLPSIWKMDVQFNADGTVKNPVNGSKQYRKPLTKEEWVRSMK